jgi:hypothetical protein
MRDGLCSQIHPKKLKFASAKSELDFQLQALLTPVVSTHNMSGWQGKTATTNGVFGSKKP